MKYIFTCLLFSFLLLPFSSISAQEALEKVFEESFEMSSDAVVHIVHRRGPIRVERTNGNTLKVKVILRAR
ncbi:MAG: hypothetical protein AAFP02_24460, partial [Bacteroidota bacterium]